MTHDEVIEELQILRALEKHRFESAETPTVQALDYAIEVINRQKLIKTRLAQIASGDYKACGHTAEEVAKTALWELTGSTIDTDAYEIEPIATQFDERLARLENIMAEAIYRDDYLHHEDYMPIIQDMQAHIRKLEKENEILADSAHHFQKCYELEKLERNPKWNREMGEVKA